MAFNKYIPKLMHICLTDSCQLKCKHCYFGEYERKRELSLEDILLVNNKFFKLRDVFFGMGYKYKNSILNISGGVK